MPLSDHIRTLLRDHDCVIIPDFGGLIADYASARIHPVRHTLAPPAKRVAFNQSLTRNDGLLVDALSQHLNLSPAQARQMIREAVARMQQELETGQRTELSGIGIFRRSAGRGLEFEYTGTDNLLSASFGLPELVSRPVRATDALNSRERQPAVPQLATVRRRASRAVYNALTAVVVGLMFSASYMFADQQGYLPESLRLPARLSVFETRPEQAPTTTQAAEAGVSRQQATLTPADNFVAKRPTTTPAELPAATPAATPKAAAADVQTPAAAKPKAAAKPAVKAPGWEKARATNATPVAETATIKSRTGRYYVVAGSYTSLANAEKGRQALVRLGHPARVILPQAGSRQFKLSVADYADRTSADRQATILRKRMGSSLWVLNY
ncbi:HU domain-containing protein [Hymenobacter psychrotolerans]|uniref:Sporulation related domain-containing protein n=1 Tax=Hymenobacter psychrotolerans DSM 18569 TaxID=1121959 RepID=A0A1M7D3B1_9BACT|nr:SPOR domain-containing protein [Hymenobacter psychrotolerans]SHL74022.1 Sporulation related domain-containing protein [Hymenobacter psychrotolerans DSM 18569]